MPQSSYPLSRSRMFWLALALWFVVVITMLVTIGPRVPAHLGDSDDALRLQQVRDLLFGGQGWYDLVQHRFDPPAGVLIHWSRLIDLPIAGMILALKPFIGLASAEIWTQRLWPLMPILPLLLGVGVIASHLGRRPACIVAMLYAALASCFVTLFPPGRIDHHNVQLATTLVLFACILTETRRAALLGGLAAALMLAIGMETLPYSVLAGTIIVLRWIAAPRTRPVMILSFVSFIAFAGLFFLGTVAPSRWSDPACDMISPVYLAPLAIIAIVLAVGSALPVDWRSRLAIAIVAGLMALACVTLINPACLKGPYAGVDPRLFTLWMNNVREARSGLDVFRSAPPVILAVLALPFGAMLATLAYLAFSRDGARFALLAPFALVVASFAIALWQVRAAPFSTMFAIPLLAVVLTKTVRGNLVTLALICLCLNPLTLPLFGVSIGNAIAAAQGQVVDLDEKAGYCGEAGDYAALARLPAGLIAAPVDLGSFIIVTTAHSALAAPYHRNRDGILSAIDLFLGPDDASMAIARRHKVDYVAYCAMSGDPAIWSTGGAGGLEARLEKGDVPAWLDPIPLAGETRLRAYRVKLR